MARYQFPFQKTKQRTINDYYEQGEERKEQKKEEAYRIVVFDILQWFEMKLSDKYAHSVYSVFHKLKSVLLLLKSIRASLYDLSVCLLFYYYYCYFIITIIIY